MKPKDLAMLMVAVAILLVAGYLGYTQLMPKKTTAAKTVQVEVVGSIPSAMDQTAITQLNDPTQVKDLDSPPDLTGLNNSTPFGQ